MIEETCLQIGALEQRYELEREARYARRNRIHYIDEMLEEFETLNLVDENEIPIDLLGRTVRFVRQERHPVSEREIGSVSIADWMEALYDVQDTLMLPSEDDID